ncbi:MAG: polysaccharide biosynthesis tyrosine autokinase [Pyrinomonadaceae bacterium]
MKEAHELIASQPPETRDLERVLDAKAGASNNSYNLYNSPDDKAHLRDYWRSVRKRLWLVIGISVLITSLAAIYLARKPDIFEAGARVQVDLERTNPALGAKDNSIIVSNPVNDPAYFNTQLQILTGPGLLRRVAKTLDLEHNTTFLGPVAKQQKTTSMWGSLLRMIGLGGKETVSNQTQEEVPLANSAAQSTTTENMAEAKRLAPYVDALQRNLKVDPVRESRLSVKETRLIDVSFKHSDPEIAAKIVNTIADTFVASNFERKSESNTSTADFLQKRIADLQADLRTREEELVNYAKNHEILSLDQSQNTVVERLAGLNRQLLEAENERKLAEAAYRAALAPGAAEAISEESNAKRFIDEAKLKLAELQRKRAELLVENTEEWPEVKEVEKQIAALEQQVKDAVSRSTTVVVKNLETKFNQAKAREDALRDAFNKQRGETLTQNEAAISYRIMQQGIETTKGLLDSLLQRSKENDVAGAGTPNNIHVVDYAIAPEDPVSPRRMLGMFVALILSLSFGVALALFLEYLDDTVRSTEEVENLLHLPALAVIPSVESGGRRRRLLPTVGSSQPRNGNGNENPELLVNADARSALAEAYRQLRTSVLLSTAGRAPKTLLITSSVPSEGKTTTAVNTAISLAQTGASVLVIDADMRRPRLHGIFDTSNGHGLSTILSSEMTEKEVLGIIQQHVATGLYLLTSGPIPPNPAELIGSEQMRSLLKVLESSFTHIVIDSPPIASFTDGVLVASMVDGVLLVVHSGKSSRGIVKRSRQLLQDVGAKIFGVVLNNVNLRSQDSYYYYNSYYHQSYYSADADTENQSATGTR